MEKKQFLKELERRLSVLPDEEVEGYKSFYSEAIDDRVEDGKSEAEAIDDLGGIDEVINQILSEKSITSLVKQKYKPRRRVRPIEIILLILGFPVWFPLMVTFLALLFVAYLLVWVFVIVTYSIEISLGAVGIAGVVVFFGAWQDGILNYGYLGYGLLGLGGTILFFFVCKFATKVTIKLAKKIALGVKRMLIGGGKQ